jgi:phosphoesterase RecJ-like protein
MNNLPRHHTVEPLRANPPSTAIDWPRFVEIVRTHQRFLLTTHVRPDGDAVGSVLAMGAALEQLGKDVIIVTDFELPRSLRFLDPGGKIKRLGKDISAEEAAAAEVLMVLDTSAWAQLGAMGDVIRATRAVKVVLDHHVSGDDLGAEAFKGADAEATGALVFEAAERLGAEITAPMAEALFVALATDTGWFRFASTRTGTFRLAARLAEAGAVPHRLYKGLYENDSFGRLQLIGRALARAQTELGGRLIYTWLTQADFAESGAVPADSEDIINLTLSVGGTEAAVILVEQPAGGVKISFRSRSDLDCSRMAEQFGGGGHRNAAGASLPDPLAAARSKVLDAVRRAMR